MSAAARAGRERLVVSARCTACGACLVTCPTGALMAAPRRPSVRQSSCTLCGECVEICPRGALSFVEAAV